RLAVTTLGDAVMIARSQRPASRRRDGAAGARNFKIQFTLRDDAAYRGVAGQTLHGLRRNSRSTLKLTCWGARNAGQRLDGCPDDQLRSRPGAVPTAIRRSLLAKLEQGIGQTLSRRTVVGLSGFHKGVERNPHRGTSLGIKQTVEPNQPVDGFTNMEIAPLIGAIGLGQCTSGIYPVFEILGHPDELAGVHRFSSLEQGGFGLP